MLKMILATGEEAVDMFLILNLEDRTVPSKPLIQKAQEFQPI